MKKKYFCYLAGFLLALQGAALSANPQLDSLRQTLEQFKRSVISNYRTLNRQAFLLYLSYWYPSLVRFLSAFTLDSPEIVEMVQELIDIETIDSYFSTVA